MRRPHSFQHLQRIKAECASRKLLFQFPKERAAPSGCHATALSWPGVDAGGLETRAASSAFQDYIPHNAARRGRQDSEVGEGLGQEAERKQSAREE